MADLIFALLVWGETSAPPNVSQTAAKFNTFIDDFKAAHLPRFRDRRSAQRTMSAITISLEDTPILTLGSVSAGNTQVRTLVGKVTITLQRCTRIRNLGGTFSALQIVSNEHRHGQHLLYQQTINLIPTIPGECRTLRAGSHEFLLSFHLPDWLPPSMITDTSCLRHIIVVKMKVSSNYGLKYSTTTATKEMLMTRASPSTPNAFRYFTGQRSCVVMAVKSSRYGRIGGPMSITARIQSNNQLFTCTADVIQEEVSRTSPDPFGDWSKLDRSQSNFNLPIANQSSTPDLLRRYPLPSIISRFPEPIGGFVATEDGAVTVSHLALSFRLNSSELLPDYDSPLFSVSHKLRLRFKFVDTSTKEIVVKIPMEVYKGYETNDDLPPCYEEAEYDYFDLNDDNLPSGRGRRTWSVATLPVYQPKEEDLPCGEVLSSSDSPSDWIDADLNMNP